MQEHARATYPDECCGFLIGTVGTIDGLPSRRVATLERARNGYDGQRHHRFLIPTEVLRDLERRVGYDRQSVLGFYHSHPNRSARPSQFDQDHAWPGYSYVVLAVTSKGVSRPRAYEIDPDSSAFREVPLRVGPVASLPQAKAREQAKV